jgi:thiol:disulfide interchange protein DsbD
MKSWQGSLEEQDQVLILSFMLSSEEAKSLTSATDMFFFPEQWGVILNATPQEITVADGTLMIKAQRDTRPLSEIQTLNGVFTYKDSAGKNNAASLSLPITSTPLSSPLGSGIKGEGINNVKTITEDTTSFAQAIFLALLGGLILNLMPCVFPVLSMKALSLVKMSDREQKHANLHGIFYTLGVMVCFGAIAGTLIALQQAGEEIGWGFQLQNPVVVLLLAYLLFAMALNLSGFFEMKGHLFTNIGHKLAAKHGYTGTFFTGMLATIVATPCTAPFMATAMGYALTQPPVIALGVFMALALGLSLPYLLLCFIPPLRKSLPKPGAWMETFRQFMSFPLFASVAWLIWVYAQQVSGDYGTLIGLSGLLLIAFSIWISHHEPRRQPLKTGIHALSVTALILALMVAGLSHVKSDMTAKEISQDTKIPSIAYSKETLDKLLAGDDPVFVDMTASWCITCQVNERIALYTDSTSTLFKEKNVHYVVGNWTNRNPEITAYLATYGRNGVPLYVYYAGRDPKTGTRPDAEILPQLLTSGLVADVINGVE